MDTKRIAKNTLFLYIRMLLVMFVSLFTSRVLLNALGETDYGLNNVLAGLIVVFSFINGSLSAATSRYLTYSLGQEDKSEVEKIFSISLMIHGCLALVVVLLGGVIGGYIVNEVMNIPPERHYACNIVFVTVIISSVLSIIQVPFNALIISNEKMGVYAYVGITEAVSKCLIAYLVMVYGGDKLIMLSILQLLLVAILFVFYVSYCRRVFRVKMKFVGFAEKKLCKEMLGYSSWSMIGSGANMLKTQGVNLLINIFFGSVVNAANAVAYNVNAAVISFSNNFTMAINPQIIKSYASGKIEEMKSLMFLGGKLTFFMLMFLCLPIIFETRQILDIWLVKVPEYAVVFTRLVLVLTMVESFTYTIGYAIQATGKIKYYQIVISGLTLMNFPVSLLLYWLGMPPYTALFVSVCISTTTLMMRLYFIKVLLKISPIEYFKKVFVRVFVTLSISLPLPYMVYLNMEESLVRMCVVFLTIVITNVIMIWLFGMTSVERGKVKDLIEKKIRKC